MAREKIFYGCDGDCFHCPYPDCLAPNEVISHMGKGCKKIIQAKSEDDPKIAYLDTHELKYLQECELL
ncbi:MAG: hypothetical protein ACI4FZ_02620 [Lachnospiraceae bacterium]